MLGYKKEESIFLPQEYLRGIFNLAGIVMPAILLNGRVVGCWRKKGKKITFGQFGKLAARDRKTVEGSASKLYPELSRMEWKER